MFCSQCGKKIGENEKFCRYCRKKNTYKQDTLMCKGKRIQFQWIVGIVIALLVIFAGMLMIDQGDFVISKEGAFPEKDVSVGGTYYGSYQDCSNKMPLGIDDNIWGMTKEEFEGYSGILLNEEEKTEGTGWISYELPYQSGNGYSTDWLSDVVFCDGCGLGIISLYARTTLADEAKPDLSGDMLNWMKEYGTYIAKTKSNKFILYELDESYALLQNFNLQYNNRINSEVSIYYLSKEAQEAGYDLMTNVDIMLEEAAKQGDNKKGAPIVELFYEDFLLFTVYSEDIKTRSIKVLEVKGEEQTEYAVQIELQSAKAEELKSVTSQYLFKNVEMSTLRTEAEEIEIENVIAEGKVCIAWFEQQEAAERYAEWLRNE